MHAMKLKQFQESSSKDIQVKLLQVHWSLLNKTIRKTFLYVLYYTVLQNEIAQKEIYSLTEHNIADSV